MDYYHASEQHNPCASSQELKSRALCELLLRKFERAVKDSGMASSTWTANPNGRCRDHFDIDDSLGKGSVLLQI